MKILFKNKTRYSEKLYETYCDFHNQTFGFRNRLKVFFICAILLFCLACQIQYHNYMLIFIFSCGIIGIIFWEFFYPFYLGKKELESDTIKKEESYTFTFFEDYFTILR